LNSLLIFLQSKRKAIDFSAGDQSFQIIKVFDQIKNT